MPRKTIAELQEIAAQLACPNGAHGIKTAEAMNISNRIMTLTCLDYLRLIPGESLLEIGPGNAQHVTELLRRAADLTYYGADISATMVAEAHRLNATAVQAHQASFALSDGHTLPFTDSFFDKIFTINTLYFWPSPLAYLLEIKRVLQPSGQFNLCFAEKSSMEKLPFTQFGFRLYDSKNIDLLLQQAGFAVQQVIRRTEQVVSKIGEAIERKFVVVCAAKNES